MPFVSTTPEGGTDCNAFYLSHWHLIDIFVYFSHHCVTIPPPGWIDCAHLHGIQVRMHGCLLCHACCPRIHRTGPDACQAARTRIVCI